MFETFSGQNSGEFGIETYEARVLQISANVRDLFAKVTCSYLHCIIKSEVPQAANDRFTILLLNTQATLINFLKNIYTFKYVRM